MKMSKQMLETTNILTPDKSPLNNQELLTRLISLANKITTAEGNTKTVIPYLSICRHTYESSLIPSVLSPAFLPYSARRERASSWRAYCTLL